jgi:hypothetical protein
VSPGTRTRTTTLPAARGPTASVAGSNTTALDGIRSPLALTSSELWSVNCAVALSLSFSSDIINSACVPGDTVPGIRTVAMRVAVASGWDVVPRVAVKGRRSSSRVGSP